MHLAVVLKKKKNEQTENLLFTWNDSFKKVYCNQTYSVTRLKMQNHLYCSKACSYSTCKKKKKKVVEGKIEIFILVLCDNSMVSLDNRSHRIWTDSAI